MTIDADRYFDDGPLVVRTEDVGEVCVDYRPVQAAGNRIEDGDVVTARRDKFKERFRRL